AGPLQGRSTCLVLLPVHLGADVAAGDLVCGAGEADPTGETVDAGGAAAAGGAEPGDHGANTGVAQLAAGAAGMGEEADRPRPGSTDGRSAVRPRGRSGRRAAVTTAAGS